MTHSDLVDKIVKLEWPMFSSVNNEGGKASCQMNPGTFRIMRESQYNTWSDELLKSHLEDLSTAQKKGRNLMSEKYARMMESTFPEEYAQIASQLPPLDPETRRLVDEIVEVHVKWKEILDEKYPNISGRGRALRSKDDIRYGQPSLETYLRAELQTFSPRTVALYHKETMDRVAANRSEAEENLLNQVRQYGFGSLEDANENLGAARA